MIHAHSLNNSGKTIADGFTSEGGKISFNIQTISKEVGLAHTSAQGKTKGGKIQIAMGKNGDILSSGTHNVCGKEGGDISIISNNVSLPAAKLLANGSITGGTVHISQNDPLASSKKKKGRLKTNSYTKIEVDGAKLKGRIDLWVPPIEEKITPQTKLAPT